METTPGIPSIKVTRTVKRFRGRATPVARPVRFTAPRAAKPMAAEATAVPTARRIRISSTSRRKPSTIPRLLYYCYVIVWKEKQKLKGILSHVLVGAA